MGWIIGGLSGANPPKSKIEKKIEKNHILDEAAYCLRDVTTFLPDQTDSSDKTVTDQIIIRLEGKEKEEPVEFLQDVTTTFLPQFAQ